MNSSDFARYFAARDTETVRAALQENPFLADGGNGGEEGGYLLTAAEMGWLDGVRLVLEAGVSLNTWDEEVGDALCCVVEGAKKNPQGALLVTQFLLEQGADPDRGTDDGATPLRRLVELMLDEDPGKGSLPDLLGIACALVNAGASSSGIEYPTTGVLGRRLSAILYKRGG